MFFFTDGSNINIFGQESLCTDRRTQENTGAYGC